MRHILTLLLLFIAVQVHAANYYWVGGGGNWSDLNHWRLGSVGGAIPSIVPSQADNVSFTASSGFGTTVASRTVTLDANGFCRDMSWASVPNNPFFTTSNATFTVEVWGNLSLSPTTTYASIFTFKGNLPATITTNGTVLGAFGMNVDKPASTLSVADSLIVPSLADVPTSYLTLTSGTLDVSGKKVRHYRFLSNNTNARTLDMTNANLAFTWYDYRGANKVLNAAGSLLTTATYLLVDGGTYNRVINYGGSFNNQFAVSNTKFSTLRFMWPSGISLARLDNGNTVDSLEFFGQGNVITNNTVGYVRFATTGTIGTGNTLDHVKCEGGFTVGNGLNTVDSLVLAANYVTNFNGTFNINKYLYVNGQPCEAFTEINGNPTTGSLNFAAGAVAGLSNVVLTGVRAFGPVTPITVSGVDGEGNQGFIINPPGNVTGTTLYWVSGPGSWNDRSHWSTSSGGAGGACIPFIADNVIFDANSGLATGVVTTSSGSFCRNMSWTGVGNIGFNESATSRFRIYGSLVMDNSVIMNAGLEFVGDQFSTITTNGSTLGGFVFRVAKTGGGVVTLTDNWVNPAGAITQSSGGLNLSGRTVSVANFASNISSPRTLDISNATLSFSQYWDYRGLGKSLIATGSNLTSFGGFGCDGQTYATVDVAGTSGTGIGFPMTGTTFGKLTFSNPSPTSTVFLGQGNTVGRLEFKGRGGFGSGNVIDSVYLAGSRNYSVGSSTINKYMQAIATPCSGLTEIRGISAVLTFGSGATVNMANVYMQGVSAAGPITPIAFSGADAGGNSGWTITSAPGASRYWVGGSGDWNDSSHWSASSGGSGRACIPTVFDDVFFDGNSGFIAASRTVTINNGNAYCHDLSWAGATNSPLWNKAVAWNMEVWGENLVVIPNAAFTVSPLTLKGATSTSLQGLAPTGDFDIQIDKPGGTLTLTGDYSNTSSDFLVRSGSLNVAGRTLNVSSVDNLDLTNASNIDISNAVITAATLWRYSNNAAAHVLNSDNSSISATTFIGTGLSYNKVNVSGILTSSAVLSNTSIDSLIFTNASNSSQVGINGTGNQLNYVEYKGSGGVYGTANTIDTLVFFPGSTYVFNAGTNTTINGEWFGSGTPCRLTEIVSSSASASATITKNGDGVTFDYVRLRRITAMGAATPFTALDHSIDQGNNTNWDIAIYNGAAPIFGLGPDTAVFATQFPYVLRTDGFFGAPSSRYTWNDSSTADSLVIAQEGTYNVNVNFVDGCNISDTIVVTKRPPLPVTLVSFEAAKENGIAQLSWATTEETNSDRFEVEKSNDGKAWALIGTVSSNGESTVKKTYRFVDIAPESGQNLYRLKMVDKDGTFAYSRVRSLSWEGSIAFAYPNPVVDRLYLNAGATTQARLISVDNLAGITVLQAQAASHLDLKTLPAGMYILKVTYQDGSVRSQKIIRGK